MACVGIFSAHHVDCYIDYIHRGECTAPSRQGSKQKNGRRDGVESRHMSARVTQEAGPRPHPQPLNLDFLPHHFGRNWSEGVLLLRLKTLGGVYCRKIMQSLKCTGSK